MESLGECSKTIVDVEEDVEEDVEDDGEDDPVVSEVSRLEMFSNYLNFKSNFSDSSVFI